MRKEEKHEVVSALAEQMKEYGNFYITDTSELTVEKINNIRRKCFENNIGMQVVKNTLIKKALEQIDGDVAPLFDALKGASSIMFSITGSAPAKLIQALRKQGDKPVLKAAYIDSTAFIGDNQLATLASLKSREELIGDIIGLLQSPAKNVISGLQSGGNKLAGIVKTLQERG
ncbi:LSU ribosomal protein L10P [Pseudopedobacter saltans DSM 12145]|uniref:Large ribosomal subunit protein uL10 n=1 Tax=Pseudopedobacter saltans (strain ATCC 51119 / DSM 12145 / JCM 21818 / CCUG 39354 / LMG 10337 / NBRC 100064 / NCIMB 13643) TaxID=762903 RepID=F0SCI1_PSESL|nr:50S ribosomal protein L10 [Pseudopedobacter saltans]ADY52815.1 LSU ribosomal protein L10P [Pseudopedobacter saltans DSM 12145]